jgi:hypothetical protein
MDLEELKKMAEELGVPVLAPIKRPPAQTEEEKAKEKKERDEAISQIRDYMEETIAVCGACYKKISRRDMSRKEPCGHTECPFGILTNKN